MVDADGIPDAPRNGMTQAEALARNDALLSRHLSLGSLTANINVTSGRDMFVLGGTAERDAFAQIGHGGIHTDVISTDGNIEVRAGRDLVVQRGSARGRAGDGINAMGEITDPTLALGSLRGNVFTGADASRTSPLTVGATGAYSQVAGASFAGVAGAGGGIPLAGGQGSAYRSNAAGGGVLPFNAAVDGTENLYSDGAQFHINNAYAKIGHGQHRYAEDANGVVGTGTPEREHRDQNLNDGFNDNGNDRRTPSGTNSVWDGNVIVAVGQDATFTGAMIGQKDLFTANVNHGSVQTNTGDTIVGVGREDATGSMGVLTTDATSVFTSADSGVNGALRFYAPTRNNLAMAAGTIFNGSLYPGVPALTAAERGDEYLPYPDFTFVAGVHGEPTGDFLQSNPYPVLNALGFFYDVNLADLTTLVPGASPFTPGVPAPPVVPVLGGGGDELPPREEEEEIIQQIVVQLPVIEEETAPVVIPFDPTAGLFDIFEINAPSIDLFDTTDGAVGTGDADGEYVFLFDRVTGEYIPIRTGGNIEYNDIPVGGGAATGSPYNTASVAGDTFNPGIPNFVSDGSNGSVSVELIVTPLSLAERPVIADRNSGLFYPAGSPDALAIPEGSAVEFDSQAAAEAAGYQSAASEEEEDEGEEDGGFGDLFNNGGDVNSGDIDSLLGDPAPNGEEPDMAETPFE
ncbi:MAG: hypothetical protein AAF485_16840 [Chloroflexota bacterium]